MVARKEDAKIAAALRAGGGERQHDSSEMPPSVDPAAAAAAVIAHGVLPLHGLVAISCDVHDVNRWGAVRSVGVRPTPRAVQGGRVIVFCAKAAVERAVSAALHNSAVVLSDDAKKNFVPSTTGKVGGEMGKGQSGWRSSASLVPIPSRRCFSEFSFHRPFRVSPQFTARRDHKAIRQFTFATASAMPTSAPPSPHSRLHGRDTSETLYRLNRPQKNPSTSDDWCDV